MTTASLSNCSSTGRLSSKPSTKQAGERASLRVPLPLHTVTDSLPLLEQFDSQALFITQERQIYLTSGLEDAFTLSSGDYTLAGTV